MVFWDDINTFHYNDNQKVFLCKKTQTKIEIGNSKSGEQEKKIMSNEIELLGAGIVKPNVLKTAGLAPNERKGVGM
ncbi:MAG: hypothetical protein DLD55_01985 [candidate division SR1 bacterium]|nr:MAG: hypothetical protein DLD55_01985 [candidate division SR1 bacterium]